MTRKKKISLNSKDNMTQAFLDQFGATMLSDEDIKALVEDPSTPRGLDMKTMKMDLPKPMLVEFSNYYEPTPEKIAGTIGIMDRLYYVLDFSNNRRNENSPKQYYLRIVDMRLRINDQRAKVLGWSDHFNWWSINPAKQGADHVDTIKPKKTVKPVTTLPDCLGRDIQIGDYIYADIHNDPCIGQVVGFTEKSRDVKINVMWSRNYGSLKNENMYKKWCSNTLIIHEDLQTKMMELKLLASK